MQPYFFPYVGYWQLIHAADTFVIYDDVNYIKGGWINRNRILVNQQEYMLTLPLERSSPNKLINEIDLCGGHEKLIKTISMAYGKAPYFTTTMPLIEDILRNPASNLALFLEYSIRQICDFVGIKTKIMPSSGIEKDNTLRSQEKILDICQRLDANRYINSIGGQLLYDAATFKSHGVELAFVQPPPFVYKQLSDHFIPSLSIIDVLMCSDRDAFRDALDTWVVQ
jgi:hypothetical protein